jgi:hypothetical protein
MDDCAGGDPPALGLHGVRLTPREAIAVVHEVCGLLRRASFRGQHLAPPRLHELAVTNQGAIVMQTERRAQSGDDSSLNGLIDELLPLDGMEPPAWGGPSARSQRGRAVGHGAAAARVTDDCFILQQLYVRARSCDRHHGHAMTRDAEPVYASPHVTTPEWIAAAR